MDKSFSIIIPMYNSETTIEKTLLSVVNANYDQNLIEIHVVDDGSKDNSLNIVKKLSQTYKNITLHTKNNGQWGSVINYAKNKKIIKNNYVAVLDSDDLYDKNTFKILNNIAKHNADILCGSFKKFNGIKPTKKINVYWFLFKRNIKNKYQMITPYCLPLPFFIKKEIFCNINDIIEGCAYQDPDYITQMFKCAKLITFTRKTIGYYYYNRAGNSISQKWDQKRQNAELNACKKCIENDSQEMVSYRLNINELKNFVKQNKIVFNINRKFSFKWYPIYIRWIYFLLHFLKFRKFFNYKPDTLDKPSK